jgi:hypothetical protein
MFALNINTYKKSFIIVFLCCQMLLKMHNKCVIPLCVEGKTLLITIWGNLVAY